MDQEFDRGLGVSAKPLEGLRSSLEKQWSFMGSRLILILSSERSGSTLLRAMLGGHSRIIAPAELFLLRYADYATWRREKPFAINSLEEYFSLIEKPRTPLEIDAWGANRTTPELYRRMFDFLRPGTYLLDKTPAYSNEIQTLRRSLEFRPFCIWLIRHPLGVINSCARLAEQKQKRRGLKGLAHRTRDRLEGLLDNGMTKRARSRELKWIRQQKNICSFLRDLPEYQKSKIYFEDLVSEPQATLAQLLASMGLPFEPAVLSPFSSTSSVVSGLGDCNFNTRESIEAELAWEWCKRYSESSLRKDTLEIMESIDVRRQITF